MRGGPKTLEPPVGTPEPRKRSRRRASERCIEPGRSAANAPLTRLSLPFSQTQSAATEGSWTSMNYLIAICISSPWSARPESLFGGKWDGKWCHVFHFPLWNRSSARRRATREGRLGVLNELEWAFATFELAPSPASQAATDGRR